MITALLAAAAALAAPARAQPPLADRFFYCSTNLQVEDNAAALERLLARAAAAGYTGVVLADSKFARLGDLPQRYFDHAARVKAAAAAAGLEVVPCVFPVGYSNDLLWHDPNLAEALPVRDAVFVVAGGSAGIAPSPPLLPGGDMSDLALWSWKDETVTPDAGAALVRDPAGRNARLVQRLSLRPFRQYHVSVRVRSGDFRGTPEVKVLAARGDGGHDSLVYSSLGVRPTQEWTTHHAVFNTLEHADVALYLGCWDGSSGSLWWDDAAVEEVGLLNVVRREGAPLSVRREGAGGARGGELVEGEDFEPVRDERMGVVPWPGAYEVWHEPPRIALRTPLPDGTRLLVSYHHAVTVYDGQVMICPSEPRTLELLRDQAERVHRLWGAGAYFMSHDEVRCLNQDESCRRRGLSAGEILADNARRCVEILRAVNPGGRLYVWSDMFDPHHNARDHYYLVRGDLAGAWEGLDRGVIVAAWHFDQREKSLAWFAGRGHPLLLAGYYDAEPGRIGPWLDAAAGVGGARGVMYTTWRSRYDDLEAFADAAWRRR